MQSRPDKLSVTSDDPTPAARVEVCDDLEIRQCRAGPRLLVAAGFLLMLACVSLAFGWWDGLVAYDTQAGYAGVVLFGVLTGWLIWQLPSGRGAVVVITPFGIRDLRIGNEFLVWDSIADVSAGECRGHRVIVLTPTPALRRLLRGMGAWSPAAQTDGVVIDPNGLSTDFDTLLRACRACHVASRAGRAAFHEHEHDAQGFAVQAS